MNLLLLLAIPLVLVIAGMILNSIGSFDQPKGSTEQDPTKRAAAEKQAYADFFNEQRTRFLKRQRRVGQYAWLVLAAFVVSFGWLYFDTVKRTAASNQVSAIQTLRLEDGKDMILSVTLRDGSHSKYLVKSPQADVSDGASKEALPKTSVSSWEVTTLRTALSLGDNALPHGIALKISE